MTGLPPEAEREILDKLAAQMYISSDEVADILARHGVEGDIDALQTAYRKRLGQRLMAGIRDEHGRREVLAARGQEYIIVDCCNDQQKLQAVRRRIQGQINGLDSSARKVGKRIHLLERFKNKFQQAG